MYQESMPLAVNGLFKRKISFVSVENNQEIQRNIYTFLSSKELFKACKVMDKSYQKSAILMLCSRQDHESIRYATMLFKTHGRQFSEEKCSFREELRVSISKGMMSPFSTLTHKLGASLFLLEIEKNQLDVDDNTLNTLLLKIRPEEESNDFYFFLSKIMTSEQKLYLFQTVIETPNIMAIPLSFIRVIATYATTQALPQLIEKVRLLLNQDNTIQLKRILTVLRLVVPKANQTQIQQIIEDMIAPSHRGYFDPRYRYDLDSQINLTFKVMLHYADDNQVKKFLSDIKEHALSSNQNNGFNNRLCDNPDKNLFEAMCLRENNEDITKLLIDYYMLYLDSSKYENMQHHYLEKVMSHANSELIEEIMQRGILHFREDDHIKIKIFYLVGFALPYTNETQLKTLFDVIKSILFNDDKKSVKMVFNLKWTFSIEAPLFLPFLQKLLCQMARYANDALIGDICELLLEAAPLTDDFDDIIEEIEGKQETINILRSIVCRIKKPQVELIFNCAIQKLQQDNLNISIALKMIIEILTYSENIRAALFDKLLEVITQMLSDESHKNDKTKHILSAVTPRLTPSEYDRLFNLVFPILDKMENLHYGMLITMVSSQMNETHVHFLLELFIQRTHADLDDRECFNCAQIMAAHANQKQLRALITHLFFGNPFNLITSYYFLQLQEIAIFVQDTDLLNDIIREMTQHEVSVDSQNDIGRAKLIQAIASQAHDAHMNDILDQIDLIMAESMASYYPVENINLSLLTTLNALFNTLVYRSDSVYFDRMIKMVNHILIRDTYMSYIQNHYSCLEVSLKALKIIKNIIAHANKEQKIDIIKALTLTLNRSFHSQAVCEACNILGTLMFMHNDVLQCVEEVFQTKLTPEEIQYWLPFNERKRVEERASEHHSVLKLTFQYCLQAFPHLQLNESLDENLEMDSTELCKPYKLS